LEQASDHGDTEAQLLLGMCYKEGKGVAKSESCYIRFLTKSADDGCSEAQLELGKHHLFIYHVESAVNGERLIKRKSLMRNSLDNAECWLRKAADQNNLEAGYHLALVYLYKDNPLKAVQLLHVVACNGDPESQQHLGQWYESGFCVTKDLPTAASYYRKAANQGHAYAQYRLGCCYQLGSGVDLDCLEAEKWFQMAAKQGSSEAKVALQSAHGRKVDSTNSGIWNRLFK
jgi:TPR repeat protein